MKARSYKHPQQYCFSWIYFYPLSIVYEGNEIGYCQYQGRAFAGCYPWSRRDRYEDVTLFWAETAVKASQRLLICNSWAASMGVAKGNQNISIL